MRSLFLHPPRHSAPILVAAIASLLAALSWSPLPGSRETTVSAGPGATLSLDMDVSDGVCTDIDPAVNRQGGSFNIGVCLSNPGTIPIAGFGYRVLYDDMLIAALEVADVAPALDDNPDANTGTTTFSTPHLGSGWDCTGGIGEYPKGDVDGVQDGDGTAFSGNCGSAAGPNTLLSGPLGVITFDVLGLVGPSQLTLSNVAIVDDNLEEVGTCSPVVDVPMTCNGGTVDTGLTSHCYIPSPPDDELRPNGPNVPGDDATWPYADPFANECESDDDNDGLEDYDEASGAACGGMISDSRDVDTDGDHLHDGWECANGSDPWNAASKFLGVASAADGDGDRVPDLWESRGYNSSGGVDQTDRDGDGCHDLVEIASVDANRTVGIPDQLAVARRALNIWGPDPDQDWVLDIDANGVVGTPDRLFVARAALLPDWQPKSCP